jgi:hypothetical protein
MLVPNGNGPKTTSKPEETPVHVLNRIGRWLSRREAAAIIRCLAAQTNVHLADEKKSTSHRMRCGALVHKSSIGPKHAQIMSVAR